MQLIRNPKQFDVMVTGNIFGDILSDEVFPFLLIFFSFFFPAIFSGTPSRTRSFFGGGGGGGGGKVFDSGIPFILSHAAYTYMYMTHIHVHD